MPTVFAVSVVFGGGLGMVAAAAFGVDAGGGFIVGTAAVFMFLSVAVLLSREMEATERLADAQDRLRLLVERMNREVPSAGK